MRSHFLAAALAVAIAGCVVRAPLGPAPPAGSFSIAPADFDRDPRSVPGAAAALDLDVAVRVFDEAYAGVDGAPRLPSAERVAAVRARLAARPRWTPAELVAELVALFRMPDGHLAFGWDGRSPFRREAWPRLAPSGSFALADFMGDDADDTAVTMVPGAVPRLVVRTFDSAAARDLARLPAIARRLRELPAFIVDLRGNGGGNFGYAERFVIELTDATLRRLDEREVVSVAAAEGRANSARRRVALGEVPAFAQPVFRAHIEALEAEAAALRERGEGRADLVTTGGVVRGRAPGPLRGRAVILVDGGCASACEMAVALARQIPGVVIAGEATRGSMAAGEMALFRLPRSGVTISLGTRAFHDPLGGFAETRGFLPDVPLGPGRTLARAEALALGLGAESAPPGGLAAERPSEEHDPAALSRVESRAPTRVSSQR